jgi:hypothetical protein
LPSLPMMPVASKYKVSPTAQTRVESGQSMKTILFWNHPITSGIFAIQRFFGLKPKKQPAIGL